MTDEIVPIVRRDGDATDKCFGAVALSPTAAADALRSVEGVMDHASNVLSFHDGAARSLDINRSVSTDPVLFAAVGTASRLESLVIGAALDRAAKLDKHNQAENKPGRLPQSTGTGWRCSRDIVRRGCCANAIEA